MHSSLLLDTAEGSQIYSMPNNVLPCHQSCKLNMPLLGAFIFCPALARLDLDALYCYPLSILSRNFTKYADEQEWKEETVELKRAAKRRAEVGVEYDNVF